MLKKDPQSSAQCDLCGFLQSVVYLWAPAGRPAAVQQCGNLLHEKFTHVNLLFVAEQKFVLHTSCSALTRSRFFSSAMFFFLSPHRYHILKHFY